MGKYWLAIVAFVSVMLLSACGGGGETSTEPMQTEEGAAAGPFRIAVVLPSAANDLAFSQSMYDGLVNVQKELGADAVELAYSENTWVVDDAAAAIRDYASKGYDLIIAHGSQYGSSIQEIAPDFPETSFAWGMTVDTLGLPNVYAYEARTEEGGYVNGVLAATMSTSNVLGMVVPIETGDAKLYVDGFVAGAKATKPDIQVNVNYIGSFSDTALAAEAATTHINAGADGLTGTAQMVVGAIGVAQEKGVPWFGNESNQAGLASETVVVNQVYDWTGALKTMIEQIRAGKLGGESYALTLENGGLRMVFNPDYPLSTEARALADEAFSGIVDGTISIPTE